VAPAPAGKRVVNVKARPYGALGNGVKDDTAAIQKAIQAVAGTGGTVLIPAGTYLVDPVADHNAGLRLGSDMTLRLEPGAVLQAKSTTTSNYSVVAVVRVKQVAIVGGTIAGNRDHNQIQDEEEGGIGLKVLGSSQVFIQGVTAKDCWEDGFYVGEGARDVTLCQCLSDNNRRQGLSVTSADGLLVSACGFRNTTGFMEKGSFACGSGIDLEPNEGQTVSNVTITGCDISGNAGVGLGIGPPVSHTGRAFVTQVVVDGNTVNDNAAKTGVGGIEVSNTSGHQITGNTLSHNVGNGIYLCFHADNNQVSGNTVTGTRPASGPGSDNGNGILLYKTGGNQVTGNTANGNAGCGLRDAASLGPNTFARNNTSGNHRNQCL